jgi:hypothetical protein
LTGDPGTDQATLTSYGYLGGKIMAIAAPHTATSNESVIVPCDVDATLGSTEAPVYGSGLLTGAGNVPFGVLMNGPGEFAGAIGPSGSKKAPVVRAMWQGNVNSEAYDPLIAFGQADVITLGALLYCGGNANHNQGLFTSFANASSPGKALPVGICTHVPTTAEPWLGVASLL